MAAASTTVVGTEADAVGEDGEEDGEERQRTWELWASIPEPVIGLILAKLPFSSLPEVSRVCRGWRALIVAGRPRLVFFHRERLVVHNADTGAWDFMQLRCPAALQDRLGPFHLVASSAGLLCFRTNHFREFVICNALTGASTTVDMPYGDRSSKDACMPKVVRGWPEVRTSSPRFLVGLTVDGRDARRFHLTVACCVSDMQGRVIVYDSAACTWDRIRDEFNGVPIHIGHRGDVYVISWLKDKLKPELCRYDPADRRWRAVALPADCAPPWKVLEFDGGTSLMTGDPAVAGSVAVFELRGSEAVRWPVARTRPLLRMFDAIRRDCRDSDTIEGLSCSGLGKHMFFTGIKKSESDSRSGPQLSLRTGLHDFSSNSVFLSAWGEFSWLRGCPSAVCQILQPSW